MLRRGGKDKTGSTRGQLKANSISEPGRRQKLNLAQEHESETTTAVVPRPGASAPACQRRGPVVPTNQVYFPLTPDHKLLYVIVLNVSRAVITNYFILLTIAPVATHMCEIRRTFTLDDFTQAPQNIDGTPAIPPAFTPTKLQEEVPHPGWIDLFPSPQLRDNLILAVEEFKINEDEILRDLIGDIFEALGCGPEQESTVSSGSDSGAETGTPSKGISPTHENNLKNYTPSSSAELGILSWSDPWDISGWEFTEKFVSKWGFLLQGCPDVVNAANSWRTLRGEDPLIVEV
ncbi:hypothetical protein TARUN_6402 [Trichoderma arundinaceum]|uniref:Uncharacterized protein n=1 Tax=Trichoderma arundinaceum TaxID=490622 RepID=A0A395NIF7_TRIAR|nr:hypothetical protein TARUN_6402 [Trichoderma arundinaceum]